MKFLASLLKTASGEQYTIYYIPYIISDDPFLPIYRPVISFADFCVLNNGQLVIIIRADFIFLSGAKYSSRQKTKEFIIFVFASSAAAWSYNW